MSFKKYKPFTLGKAKKTNGSNDNYKATKDLLNATPGIVVGVTVAGMIPKLVP